MRCNEARAALWPPERPRLADPIVTEAREHVTDCPECRAYFEQDRRLLAAYDRIRRTRAPRRVRERVFDALARARAGDLGRAELRRHVRLAAPFIAAAALLLVVGTTWLVRSGAPRAEAPGQEMFVEDYLRRAVGADHIETSDPAEVSRFLMRELGLPLAPITTAGLEVQRVEICLLEGRRGAMIVYKRDGQVISHYLVPRPRGTVRPPAPGRDLGDGIGAPSVITWASPNLEQALVGEVPAEALMTLARRAPSLD